MYERESRATERGLQRCGPNDANHHHPLSGGPCLGWRVFPIFPGDTSQHEICTCCWLCSAAYNFAMTYISKRVVPITVIGVRLVYLMVWVYYYGFIQFAGWLANVQPQRKPTFNCIVGDFWLFLSVYIELNACAAWNALLFLFRYICVSAVAISRDDTFKKWEMVLRPSWNKNYFSTVLQAFIKSSTHSNGPFRLRISWYRNVQTLRTRKSIIFPFGKASGLTRPRHE